MYVLFYMYFWYCKFFMTVYRDSTFFGEMHSWNNKAPKSWKTWKCDSHSIFTRPQHWHSQFNTCFCDVPTGFWGVWRGCRFLGIKGVQFFGYKEGLVLWVWKGYSSLGTKRVKFFWYEGGLVLWVRREFSSLVWRGLSSLGKKGVQFFWYEGGLVLWVWRGHSSLGM